MDRLNHPSRPAESEEGSILPLIIGYALLAIAVILVCVDATSLYIENKRLAGVADAAALAASDGFTIDVDGGEATIVLADAEVTAQAQAIVDVYDSATLIAAESPDGVSARVTVATMWRPPFLSIFVPDGVPLEATATSRTALR